MKETNMRWSNTMELYPFAIHTCELGVWRSICNAKAHTAIYTLYNICIEQLAN